LLGGGTHALGKGWPVGVWGLGRTGQWGQKKNKSEESKEGLAPRRNVSPEKVLGREAGKVDRRTPKKAISQHPFKPEAPHKSARRVGAKRPEETKDEERALNQNFSWSKTRRTRPVRGRNYRAPRPFVSKSIVLRWTNGRRGNESQKERTDPQSMQLDASVNKEGESKNKGGGKKKEEVQL